MSEYVIKYEGKIIVGTMRIVDYDHALEIKAAIDNPELGIEVEVAEVQRPPIPREIPEVGYWLIGDKLKMKVSESPYGGWSFTDDGYDRSCRLFERSDGQPPDVLVYATTSSEALAMAHEIRAIFERDADKVAAIKERMAKEQAEYEASLSDDDDDWDDD